MEVLCSIFWPSTQPFHQQDAFLNSFLPLNGNQKHQSVWKLACKSIFSASNHAWCTWKNSQKEKQIPHLLRKETSFICRPFERRGVYMHDLFQKHKSIQQKNELVASYLYVYLYGPKQPNRNNWSYHDIPPKARSVNFEDNVYHFEFPLECTKTLSH